MDITSMEAAARSALLKRAIINRIKVYV